jgi:hypothetical protein
MNHGFEKIFKSMDPLEPPAGLLGKILKRIQEEKTALSIKRRLILFSLGLAASLVGIVASFNMFSSGAAASGFSSFLSLTFSDFQSVLASWQNYTYTLLETVPVFSLAALLFAVFAFLEFLKYIARDAKSIFTLSHPKQV